MRSFIGRRDELRLGSTSLGSTPGSCFGAGAGLLWANLAGGNALDAWDFIANQARWNGSGIGALSNTPGWSFARASAGYAQTQAGALTPFASGELRRTDKGVLIEGARTNLFTYSQQLDLGSGAPWSHTGVTVTANAISAPDGTTTADKIVEVNAASTPRLANGSLTISAATAHTFSIYAKAAERDQVRIVQEGSANFSAYFLLTGAGTISGLGGSCTATITALANGWYRCTLTWTTGGTNPQSYVATASGGSTIASGDDTKGIYLWGAQLEAASFPSSYIPTTTASATRAADKPSIGGITSLTYPLSIYAEWEKNGDDPVGIYQRVIEVGQSAATDLAVIYHKYSNGKLALYATSGGAAVADLLVGTASLNATMKAACRYAVNDFTGSLNGAAVQSDTSGAVPAIAPTNIYFGTNYSGDISIFGYLRRAAIWTRALSDSELQSVTT